MRRFLLAVVMCGIAAGAQAADLPDQRHIEQVDGRMVDGRPADSAVDGDVQEFVFVVGHTETLCDADHKLTFPSDRFGALLGLTRRSIKCLRWCGFSSQSWSSRQ